MIHVLSRSRNLIEINTFEQVFPTPLVYRHSPPSLEKEIEITDVETPKATKKDRLASVFL